MQVDAIPAFDDNYIWLLTEPGSERCAVVDPGDEEPVIAELDKRGLTLSAILITHKHFDHTGGISGLKGRWPEAVVYGPTNEAIAGLQRTVVEGERFQVEGLQAVFAVLDVPGHTEGHVAYLSSDHLFCGDTLFAGGCGRVFSGTFAQMTHSLRKIRELPPETRIYCAHEYTEANLGFAAWVEPDSEALKQRAAAVASARQAGEFTVPSRLSDELATNPFLRVKQDSVVAAASRWAGTALHDETAVFTALRQWKDRDYD